MKQQIKINYKSVAQTQMLFSGGRERVLKPRFDYAIGNKAVMRVKEVVGGLEFVNVRVFIVQKINK